MEVSRNATMLHEFRWRAGTHRGHAARQGVALGRWSQRIGLTLILWWVMVDGHAGPSFIGTTRLVRPPSLARYEEMPGVTAPEFSMDSRRIAYAARQGVQWGILVDQTPVGRLYDEVVEGGPSFDPEGDVQMLGLRLGSLYRVSVLRTKRN